MQAQRRTFLKGCSAAGVVGVAVAAGLLVPARVWAAQWNKAGFESKSVPDALRALGATDPVESKEILIKAPEVAENGNTVPVEVTSSIGGTESIAVLVDKNAQPLTGHYALGAGALAYVSSRVKMGESSTVRVVVKASGKTYTAAKEVKVTIGGCGG